MDNLEKENRKLKFIIILFSVLLLAFGFFYFYEKVIVGNGETSNNSMNKDTNVEDNKQNDNDVQNVDINYDAESIAREKMPTAISIANQNKIQSTYCGGFDNEDVIEINLDDQSFMLMDASSRFKTLNELKEHLKNNLSEELINQYFKTGDNEYLEKDGKLYCSRAHKGIEWLFTSDEDEINETNPITYTISNKQADSFDVKIEAKYGLLGSTERDQVVTIYSTIINENNNWLVSKYEQK